MINRGNWKLLSDYLEYRTGVHLVSPKTVRNEETWLYHALNWAGEKPFRLAPVIKPSFQAYILEARRDGIKDKLKPAYIKKVISAVRRFFGWLYTIKKIRTLNEFYIDSIRIPRLTEEPKKSQAYTFEEIIAIANTQVITIKERRIRAAAVFMWLSGMRVGAFSSLPIKAVDLEKLEIKQWPSLGVRTKNNKFATTSFLPIPELFSVIRNWDEEIRNVLPPDGLWFSPLLPSTGEFDLSKTVWNVGENRSRIVTRNLWQWLNSVGLPYHSSQNFRHGFTLYIKENARGNADIEAARETLMQEKFLGSTYGKFSHEDIKKHLQGMVGGKLEESIMDIPKEDWPKILEIYRLIKG